MMSGEIVKMSETYIRWLLIITGVFTAASVGVFLQPVKQVAIIYGENLTGTAVTMLVRHWGLLITGTGVLIIFAAFNPPIRIPMMVLGVVEKIVLAGSILATPLRKRPIPGAIAALDLLIALLYILYMIGG
jgi:hypothetical protein